MWHLNALDLYAHVMSYVGATTKILSNVRSYKLSQ
jgi:hypothetical protein